MSSTSLPVKESAVDDLEKNADDSVRSLGSVKQSEDVVNESQGKEEASKPPSGPPGHGQGGGPPGGHGKGRGGLPPNHPMHPSQFSGDRYDRRAMMTLLGSFCVMFSSFGWINCIGVFQQFYETHQLKGYSDSTVSWIISLELFLMFFNAPVVGKLYDNFGPRYLLLTGTVLHVFGLMMASLSSEYYQFLLSQGVCSPLGCSMLFFPAMNSCISWFLKKRAFAFGVIAGGASLGGVIFPILVGRLVNNIGFAWTMRVCAFLILGLMIVGNLCVTSRLKPMKKPFSLYEFAAPLKEKPYALLAATAFVGYLGLFVPISYIVVQGASVGMSTNLQGYLVPILNGASFFGRTMPGYFADKFGRFNVMFVMSIFSAICIFAIWIPAHSNAIVIFFAAMYGFGCGAFISIMPTLVAEITTDMTKLGVRNGTSFAIISIATLIGTPISGALITACDGKFWGLQIFTGLSLTISALLLFATRTSLVGLKLNVKT